MRGTERHSAWARGSDERPKRKLKNSLKVTQGED